MIFSITNIKTILMTIQTSPHFRVFFNYLSLLFVLFWLNIISTSSKNLFVFAISKQYQNKKMIRGIVFN